MNALNLIFRIILPMCLTFLALLFTRFWPTTLIAGLQNAGVSDLLGGWPGPGLLQTSLLPDKRTAADVVAFSDCPPTYAPAAQVYDASKPLPNPPPYPVRILDNAMFAPPVKGADLWTGKPVAPGPAHQYAAAGHQGRPQMQGQTLPTNTGNMYVGNGLPVLPQQQQGSLLAQAQQQQALGYPVSQSVPQAMAFSANNSLSARPVQPQLSPPGTPQYAHAMMLPNQSYNPQGSMTPTYQPAHPALAYNNPTFAPGQLQQGPQHLQGGSVNPAPGGMPAPQQYQPQALGGHMQQQQQQQGGVMPQGPGGRPPQAQLLSGAGQVLQPQNSGPPLQSIRTSQPVQQGGQQPQGSGHQPIPDYMPGRPQGQGPQYVPGGVGPQQFQPQGPVVMLAPQGPYTGAPQPSTAYNVPGQNRAFSSAVYDARR
jgi:hypothetical protein